MNSDELILPRVRLDADTRMPVDSDSEVASKIGPATQEGELSLRMAKGKGERDTHQRPPRCDFRGVPVADKQKRGRP